MILSVLTAALLPFQLDAYLIAWSARIYFFGSLATQNWLFLIYLKVIMPILQNYLAQNEEVREIIEENDDDECSCRLKSASLHLILI